nr:immunoglobulin heavy chain junction region [Mus musculus]
CARSEDVYYVGGGNFDYW